MKKSPPKRKYPYIFLGVFLLISTSIACNLLNLISQQAPTGDEPSQEDLEMTIDEDLLDDLEATPTVDEKDLENLESALQAEIVDDRPGVLDYLGNPDAFDISIVEVEGGQVRKESWRYYQYGTRVDFVDGEAVWTIEIEPLPDDTFFAAWYDPMAFKAGMTVEETSQVIISASPANAEPEKLSLSPVGEDLAGGETLVGDQIVVGFHEGRLVYVETVALMSEGEVQ